MPGLLGMGIRWEFPVLNMAGQAAVKALNATPIGAGKLAWAVVPPFEL